MKEKSHTAWGDKGPGGVVRSAASPTALPGRRTFLRASLAVGVVAHAAPFAIAGDAARQQGAPAKRDGEIGVTRGSLMRHLTVESQPPYDLERCFQVAWKAGFRCPWCLEHFNDTLAGLLAGFVRLRDILNSWMEAA
jgi:hypothetical protein